jgi:hypothetical protein
MKCHCGVENLPDARFCARCGAALPAQPDLNAAATSGPAAAAPQAVSAPTKPKSRLGLAIGVAVVIVAAGAYWWFNRPEPDYVFEDSGLYAVKINGKFGFIDKSGTMVIQPAYDDLPNADLVFIEGLEPVKQQGKWGYIDTHGAMVIQPQYDDALYFIDRVAPVQLGSGSSAQWGFVGKDGKYVINPQFKHAIFFQGGLAPVDVNGEWGFVDKSGSVVVKPQFGSASMFSEGLAPVSLSGKWGYIDKSGKALVKLQFESAGGFSEGLAMVQSGGKLGYIDRTGKFVVNPQFDAAADFSHGFAVVHIAGKTGTIDKSGKFILNPGQVNIELAEMTGVQGDGMLVAKTEDGLGYVDKSGTWVVSPTSVVEHAGPMRGGIARVRIAGEDCYINTSGVVIWGTPKGKSVYTLEKEHKDSLAAAAAAAAAEADTAAAAAIVRTLNTTEATYVATYPLNASGSTQGFAKLATLGPGPSGACTTPDLSHACLIDSALGCSSKTWCVKDAYQYSVAVISAEGVAGDYVITATPVNAGTGRKSFCSTADGIVRFRTDLVAAPIASAAVCSSWSPL